MLQLSKTMLNRQVLSLRTGGQIATTTVAIINPDNLKIEGYYCTTSDTKQQVVLLYQDMRDVLPQGIVVNDLDALAEPSELIRLQAVLSLNFDLIGKPVETNDQQKLGRINDYAFESTTMFIQKLYVSQSMLKSLTGGTLSVDRNQVQEVTPKRVIINDPLDPVNASGVTATAPA